MQSEHAKADSEVRGQIWCGTINNPTRDAQSYFVLSTKNMRYVVWQLEETTTKHIQCYIQFSKAVSRAFLKGEYDNGHFEIVKSNYEKNYAYCTKEKTRIEGPYEIGVASGRGKRNDLLEIQQKYKDGATKKDIQEEHFPTWVRNYKALEIYRLSLQPEREWVTIVIVITGRTNIGKSWFVHDHAKLVQGHYYKQCNKDWFTHYAGESDVVLEEFNGSRFSYGYLLQLLDRYPFKVGTKGDEVNFIPKRIWITSNSNPWDWYQQDVSHLVRRITHHYEVLDHEEFDRKKLQDKLNELHIYDH